MNYNINQFYKKAQKKNQVKNIIANQVLLIKTNPLTNYDHLLNNISTILYKRIVININEVDEKTLIDLVVSSKYIFVDDYHILLNGFNYEAQTLIYLGCIDGYYQTNISTCSDELVLAFFKKITYIIVGSELLKQYYINKYQVLASQILTLGYYLNDKFYSKKWENNSLTISDHYLDFLTKINIYFVPKNFNDNIYYYLLILNNVFDHDKYNIFYYSKFTYQFNNCYKVLDDDVKYMFNNVNVILSNKNPLLFEMFNCNHHIKTYTTNKELYQCLLQILADDFTCNDTVFNKEWYLYDNGMCCRNIIKNVMRLV